MVALLRRAGLTEFQTNRHVWTGDELLEVDFFWPEAGLVVEVDSARYHGSRWRQRKDAGKTAKLRAAGFVVLRFWDAEINGAPERVAAQIAAARAHDATPARRRAAASRSCSWRSVRWSCCNERRRLPATIGALARSASQPPTPELGIP